MNKPSNLWDALDKTLEVRNFMLDMHVQDLNDEILWIDANYENINVLRNYLLNCANLNNTIANIEYANQLYSYPDSQVQNLAEEMANNLYKTILATKKRKIENKPIKLIVQELKTLNK